MLYKQTNPLPSAFPADALTTVVRATAPPTLLYVATIPADCHGYQSIDFFVTVANVGSITKLTLKFSAAANDTNTVPVVADFADYITENVAAGVATTNVYQVELNDPAPASGVRYIVSVPVRGRHVLAWLKSDSATGTVSIEAMRRPFGEI